MKSVPYIVALFGFKIRIIRGYLDHPGRPDRDIVFLYTPDRCCEKTGRQSGPVCISRSVANSLCHLLFSYSWNKSVKIPEVLLFPQVHSVNR